jgi:hypothetical protein
MNSGNLPMKKPDAVGIYARRARAYVASRAVGIDR